MKPTVSYSISGKGLVYVFIVSIVFFGILDVFAYVNASTHKKEAVFYCNGAQK